MKILYIILLIAAAIFWPLFKDDLSFILLCALIIFPVIMLIMLTAERKAVKIRIGETSGRIVRGEKLCIKIRIRNPLIFPVPCCALTVLYRMGGGSFGKYTVTVPLRARAAENVDINITPAHCGTIECIIKKAVFCDLIGLFSIGKKLNIRMSAAVMPMEYPAAASVSEDSVRPEKNGRTQVLSPGNITSEVSGLRDYRDGDRINTIHWKLSSRAEDYVVKEYSEPLSGYILVVPDMRSSQDLSVADRIADIYYSFVKFLIDDGRDTAVLTDDGELEICRVKTPQELDELVLSQMTAHAEAEADMTLTARLTSDDEFLERLYGEKYSRILIVTAAEKSVILSELEQKAAGSGITVLNVGEEGAVPEDKNSDVIIYNVFRDGNIDIPDHIAV